MRSLTLSIKFSTELVQKMTEAARAKYISRSAYIREAVAEKLNRDKVAGAEQTNSLEEIDWQRLIDQGD